MPRRAVAALVALAAFALYFSTLLPGQDLGDTASFQAIANERHHTPRQAYPLYFAFCAPFVAAMPDNPAGATNMASAVAAALAVGVFVLVGAELAGTVIAGVAAGLLLASAYTYWSQAVIAEVYALHALVIGLCLLALLSWRRAPSLPRLAVFFAVYAVGYGNHLQMALLLPAFSMYLLCAAPGGPRAMIRPRVVLLALGIAAVAALQYAPTFATLAFLPEGEPWPDRLRTFWFDVTKSDWRRNMVVTIHMSTIGDRFAMYWFDLRQQFGVAGVVAAVAGLGFLFRTAWREALLLLVGWLASWAFAFTYNVGDVHVFYLTSHLFVALAAGCGAGLVWHVVGWHLAKTRPVGARPGRPLRATLVVLLLLYPAWRTWDTYPAMDRSEDTTPTDFLAWLTKDINGDSEVFARQLNWQLHNGLDYFYRHAKPLNVLDAGPALLHFPFIVWDNAAMGRDVVLTEGAAQLVQAAYGDLLPIEPDRRLPVPTLADRLSGLPAGTPYVLSVMDSYRERPVDAADLAAAAERLGISVPLPKARYLVVMGRSGEAPVAQRAAERPFRISARLGRMPVEARIEAWVPIDTIRRMGFGHVIAGRRHVLTMDRGVSLVALAPDGSPRLTAWAGGMYTLQPRFLIRRRAAQP